MRLNPQVSTDSTVVTLNEGIVSKKLRFKVIFSALFGVFLVSDTESVQEAG